MFLKSTGVLELMVAALNVLGVLGAPATESRTDTPLSEGIPICVEDENINKCLSNSLTVLQRLAVTGIPEFKIPAREPLPLDQLNIQFSNQLISLRLEMSDITISGFSKKTVEKVEYERNGDQMKLATGFRIPKLQTKGLYKADVQLNNGQKFTRKGKFDIKMTDVQAKPEYLAEIYERDGVKFVKFTSVKMDPILGDMRISATGLADLPLFNEILVQIANNFLRDNYKAVIAANKAAWEPIILLNIDIFNSRFPLNRLITITSK